MAMTIRNKLNPRTITGFFSTRLFLVLIGICLVASSIYLWKTQESTHLAEIAIQTENNARSYTSEIEIRYGNIQTALNKLSARGFPNNLIGLDGWNKDAALLIDSYKGLKNIAWVDKEFILRGIIPIEQNQVYLNQKATNIIWGQADVTVWVPIYQGTRLDGFLLGIINLDAFIAPITTALKNDFMLQLSVEGKPVFRSKNWETPQPEYLASKIVT
jgi:sensor domain CHASE-containing protein